MAKYPEREIKPKFRIQNALGVNPRSVEGKRRAAARKAVAKRNKKQTANKRTGKPKAATRQGGGNY